MLITSGAAGSIYPDLAQNSTFGLIIALSHCGELDATRSTSSLIVLDPTKCRLMFTFITVRKLLIHLLSGSL